MAAGRIMLVLALALGLLSSACGRSGDEAPGSASASPPAPTTAAESPSVSSGTPTASPTPPPVATGRSRCTLALGMSVTANWFIDGAFESLPGIEDDRWELIWESGYDVALYADPNGLAYSAAPLSACGAEPDRVLFQVAALDWHSPDTVVTELAATIENIRATWPSVRVIELIPIVGGPDGGPCLDPDRPDKGVVASFMYPIVTTAIASVAGGDVVAGPDLELEDCAQYRDGSGHLTIDGSAYVASVLAEHFAA